MPIPSVTGFSNLVHHHLPNTAFAIVEEVYQRLPELMNLRDMLYALDKKPEFFTNAFKCSNYYGISFKEEYLDTLGYNPRSIKDMQILATHIMGDSSYTRFYYKDTIEVPNQDGTVSYLVYTFLLPKIRDISKFKVYSKDRNISREITVDSNNIFVVDATTVQGLTLTTEQTFTEILPAINSTVVTGGSGGTTIVQPSTPVEVNTGESLWEADKTKTFIPYFVTFNDLPKSVCDLAYATFDEYGKGHEIPLYWVSGTTYAIPIPCTTYVYDNEEYGETGTLNDIYIAIPHHTEVRDNKNYFFTNSYLRIYWNEGMHGLGNLNHAYISLYDTYIDITTRQVSEGIWNDELEKYEYPEVLDTYTQSYTLTVTEVIFTETTVTFNSIKPKNNNKTILEVV